MSPISVRTGYCARQLRDQDPDVKVLYFTGYPDYFFDTKRAFLEHEAFVAKPVTAMGFLEAVSLLLFGHTQGPARSISNSDPRGF